MSLAQWKQVTLLGWSNENKSEIKGGEGIKLILKMYLLVG